MTRRNTWLLIVSLVVGPAIGGLVFLAFAAITDLLTSDAGIQFIIDYWPLVMSGAYAVGFLPALVTAITAMLLANVLHSPVARLGVAALIGAITGPVMLLVLFGVHFPPSDTLIFIPVAVTGAVSALACLGLIEWLHPLPPREASP